ncbi:MAG: FAD binding domain-containing protein, partial [Trebonia sp.]
MKPFEFLTPSTLDEALAALHDAPSRTRLIAGGQSLLLEMKERAATPARLVSLGGLGQLRGWRYAEFGELIVGAAITYAALSRARLDGWHGLIPRVAGDLADRPVRTMGTIGGALCQANPRFDMPVLTVGLD